jgi:hypothetical protein
LQIPQTTLEHIERLQHARCCPFSQFYLDCTLRCIGCGYANNGREEVDLFDASSGRAAYRDIFTRCDLPVSFLWRALHVAQGLSRRVFCLSFSDLERNAFVSDELLQE